MSTDLFPLDDTHTHTRTCVHTDMLFRFLRHSQPHAHCLFPGYIVTATKLMRSQLSLSVFTFVFCVFFQDHCRKGSYGQNASHQHSFSSSSEQQGPHVAVWNQDPQLPGKGGRGGLGLRDMAEPGSPWPPDWILIGRSCCCRDCLPIIPSRRNKIVKKLCLQKNTTMELKHQSQQPGRMNVCTGKTIQSRSNVKKTQFQVGGGGRVIFPQG